MNFKYISRKQRLGISHAADFLDWALLQEIEAEKKNISLKSSNVVSLVNDGLQLWENSSPRDMQRIIEWFDAAMDDLALDFEHSDAENTAFNRTIRSLNSAARKRDIIFSIIDLRKISELGNNLSDIEILDKMVIECGCNPLGNQWIEYPFEYGRQKIQSLFDYEVDPINSSNTSPSGSECLADQYLAYFEDSMRFFGNDAVGPLSKAVHQQAGVQSKKLQSRHDVDYGFIVRDSEHIGFLLLAKDYY